MSNFVKTAHWASWACLPPEQQGSWAFQGDFSMARMAWFPSARVGGYHSIISNVPYTYLITHAYTFLCILLTQYSAEGRGFGDLGEGTSCMLGIPGQVGSQRAEGQAITRGVSAVAGRPPAVATSPWHLAPLRIDICPPVVWQDSHWDSWGLEGRVVWDPPRYVT